MVRWGVCELYMWRVSRDETREASKSHSGSLGFCCVWGAQQVMKSDTFFQLLIHSFNTCFRMPATCQAVLGNDAVVLRKMHLCLPSWSLLSTY